MDWIDLARDSDRFCVLMNVIMKGRVLQNAGYFLTVTATISLSRRTPLHGFSRLVSCNTKYSLHAEMKLCL